jgi:hypothetical protein
VETECVGDNAVLSDEEATSLLRSLRDAGYEKFKLVNQGNRYSVRANRAAAFFMHVVNSAAYGRLRAYGVSKIAEKFTDAARISKLGSGFSIESSGPWGDDIPGGWMTFEKAKSIYLRTRRAFFLKNADGFWYDRHATC